MLHGVEGGGNEAPSALPPAPRAAQGPVRPASAASSRILYTLPTMLRVTHWKVDAARRMLAAWTPACDARAGNLAGLSAMLREPGAAAR